MVSRWPENEMAEDESSLDQYIKKIFIELTLNLQERIFQHIFKTYKQSESLIISKRQISRHSWKCWSKEFKHRQQVICLNLIYDILRVTKHNQFRIFIKRSLKKTQSTYPCNTSNKCCEMWQMIICVASWWKRTQNSFTRKWSECIF